MATGKTYQYYCQEVSSNTINYAVFIIILECALRQELGCQALKEFAAFNAESSPDVKPIRRAGARAQMTRPILSESKTDNIFHSPPNWMVPPFRQDHTVPICQSQLVVHVKPSAKTPAVSANV